MTASARSGPVGQQGVQGIQGVQGEQGIQGIQGPAGPNTVATAADVDAVVDGFGLVWDEGAGLFVPAEFALLDALIGGLATKQDAATAATDVELGDEADTRSAADDILTTAAQTAQTAADDAQAAADTAQAAANAAAAAAAGAQGDADAAQVTADAALPKAGGTMTGALTLAADPTNALHAATRQYVLAQITALIAGAPGTLDTLDEIAAALGDDPNAVSVLQGQIATALQAAQNLADLADAVEARGNLGLGSAATADSGDFDAAGAAAAAQAASQPHNAANLDPIAALTSTAFGRSALELANAAAGRTLFALGDSATKNVGTAAGTVAAGDDSRLSDQRVPTASSVDGTKVASSLKPSGSAGATDESLRRLGTGATHAAAGDDSRFPSTGEKNALAGTSGTPGAVNPYVTTQDSRNTDKRTPSDGSVAATQVDGSLKPSGSAVAGTEALRALGATAATAAAGNDSRLSDARTPTAHKTSHAVGGSDALSAADLGLTRSLFTHFADVGNVGGGEDDLYSDTIAAGQLAANGDSLEVVYAGSILAHATNTRRIKVFFGGTAIYDTAATVYTTLNRAWRLCATIIRESSSVVRYSFGLQVGIAAATADVSQAWTGRLTGLTLANTQVLKITGEDSGSVNDAIVAKLGKILYIPA